MAFSAQQTRRAGAILLVVVLVLVVAVGALVISGFGSSSGTSSASSDQGSSSSTTTDAMETVDEQYGSAVETLLAQYEADPSNPSTLLSLANGYFDWGVAALSHASDDDDVAHAEELLEEAVARYDEYLADHPDAKSAIVDRAICVYYGGDTDAAIEALEELVNDLDATFAPAWANLGRFYEAAGRTDDAREAYEMALETAGEDDAYGVSDYAQARLDALE